MLGAATLDACARVDVSQPIALVPAADLPLALVEDLSDAAESWNLEVGTRLVLGDASTIAGDRVPVAASDLICSFGRAITRYAGAVDVQLCLPGTELWVLLHELGHVINIHTHAEQPTAAMSVPGSGEITEEDRALFADANPGYRGDVGCQVIRHLGSSDRPPIPFHSARGPAALIRDQQGLGVLLLDESTAERRELTARLGDASVGLFAHFDLPSGLGVIWESGGSARLQIVDGGTLQPSAALPLETGRLAVNERVISDARAVGQTLLLVLISGEGLELRRYQLPDGRWLGTPLTVPVSFSAGELHEAGGRLLLVRVPREPGADLAITPLTATGAASQAEVPMAGLKPRLCTDRCARPFMLGRDTELLVATGTARGLLLTSISPSSLQVTRSVELQTPMGASSYHEILPTARGLLLTLSASRTDTAVPDVFAGLLDESGARWRQDWRRLSPPQGRPDQFPRALETGPGAIVLWAAGDLDERTQAISRCLPLP